MNTETRFKTLAEARAFFRSTIPNIVDQVEELPRYAGHKGPAKVVEWDDSDEATHVAECPGQGDDPSGYGWDHDCWKQGCGKSWMDDWSHGARIYLKRKARWIEIGHWANYERGGMGY